jgi:phosphoglucomutase
MTLHPLAGKAQPSEARVAIEPLLEAYRSRRPDPRDPAQRVSFGTSGHRGTSLSASFNEAHVLAIAQAVVEYRSGAGIRGPLLLARDTHALSGPALESALEVFAANGVTVVLDAERGYTPTPVVSRAILVGEAADGVIITPSHNPPQDGGLKYNPPTGGPAGNEVTSAIERRANELLEGGLRAVRRIPLSGALAAPTTLLRDLVTPYVEDLGNALDLEVVAESGIRVGVDPLGGAGIRFYEEIAGRYGIDLEVVNPEIDPAFGFMPLDQDGVIRMDCSSPWAMTRLIELRDRFDVAFGNDPDVDRHGIVTPSGGLLNPNHYLAVAVDQLFRTRDAWGPELGVGKTLVTSAMLDRVARDLGRRVVEVPVGFKWFVEGLLDGAIGFAGEESAGASFLRRDGTPWTTDKDGILLALLAAEITARTGRDPGELYAELEARHGSPLYLRTQAPASAEQKTALANLSPEMVSARELAGSPITRRLTRAPGNDAPIGGLKVESEEGWFAARPSGTEDIYKIYAESFRDEAHLDRIVEEARAVVDAAFRAAGA